MKGGGKGAWLGEFFDANMEDGYWQREHRHPISYRCVSEEGCTTFQLARRALYDAINNNPRLRAMATRVEVDDLWGKLHRAPANLRRRSYQAMLEVALSDGEISSGERQLLDSFRCRHQINDDIHRKFLAELGWTMDQYAIGCQIDAKKAEVVA